MNVTELKEKLSKIDLLSTFPFINGYGITSKVNKETGLSELVVNFKVSKKINLDDLNENFILPKSLSGFNININTKVSEQLKSSVNCDNDISEQYEYYKSVGVGNLSSIDFLNTEMLYNERQDHLETLSAAGISLSGGNSINPLTFYKRDEDLLPVKYNRQKARPLSGGCSSVYSPASDATLGLLVRDKQDRSIVALSNAHVYSNNLLIGEEARTKGELDNILTLSAQQPGSNKYNKYGTSPIIDYIGTPKRTSLISKNNSRNTFTDAAIVELGVNNIIDSSSNAVLWFKEKGPYQFASREEFDSLIDPTSLNYRSPVFRSGRTLGPLGYPGNVNEDFTFLLDSDYGTPVNLTPTLTTSSGLNVFTAGLCSIDFNQCQFNEGDDEAYLLMQSADRENVYILGKKSYYDSPPPNEPDSRTLFSGLTGGLNDVETIISDSDKIKKYAINNTNGNMRGALYLTDTNKIYFTGVVPAWKPFYYQTLGFPDNPRHRDNSNYFSENVLLEGFEEVDFGIPEITNEGIKKVFSDANRLYVLTEENKLFCRGRNVSLSSRPGSEPYTLKEAKKTMVLGGDNYDVDYDTMHRIKGEYIDIAGTKGRDAVNGPYNNATFAINTDNRLCVIYNLLSKFIYTDKTLPYAEGLEYLSYEVSHADYVTSVQGTNSPILCASKDFRNNVIPIMIDGNEVRVKKILTKNDLTCCLGPYMAGKDGVGNYPTMFGQKPILLVSVDDELIIFIGKNGFNSVRPRSQVNNAVYAIDENDDRIIWNDQCKSLIESNHIEQYGYSILSGDKIMVGGYNAGADLDRHFSFEPNIVKTHFMLSATNYPIKENCYAKSGITNSYLMPNNKFLSYTGIPNSHLMEISLLQGTSRSKRWNSTIIFSDVNGISGAGENYSDMFGPERRITGIRDQVIVDEIGMTVSVGFGDVVGNVNCNEVFGITSLSGAFAVTDGGDSGTAVFACLSSTVPSASAWKFIGLVFAGPPPTITQQGKCIDVNHIVDELEIETWEGDIEE